MAIPRAWCFENENAFIRLQLLNAISSALSMLAIAILVAVKRLADKTNVG
jgi:hypothetical protein